MINRLNCVLYSIQEGSLLKPNIFYFNRLLNLPTRINHSIPIIQISNKQNQYQQKLSGSKKSQQKMIWIIFQEEAAARNTTNLLCPNIRNEGNQIVGEYCGGKQGTITTLLLKVCFHLPLCLCSQQSFVCDQLTC